MKGSIHSDQVCPICGSRFKSQEPKGLFCPNHPHQQPTKFKVIFGKVTRRFNNYPSALQFLTGLRFQEGSGVMDERDYQIKAKPLSFDKLAEEWLAMKATQIKPGSLRAIAVDIRRAQETWGETNVKSIQYPQIEDFIRAHPGASKTKANALASLKQLFAWVHDRYDVPSIKKWPKLGYVEMAFRDTVGLDMQDAIIEDIKKHEAFKVWLCIKWLATYISIRPGEMRSLAEKHVDRQRGILIVPHPKEKRSKIIPLIQEDIDIIRTLPLAFDQSIPFFRHEDGKKIAVGTGFGHNVIYRSWKRACNRLGVEGVSLYPGTKHSTAMGLRAVATPEEIKSMTLHSTSQAFNRYFQTGGEDLRALLGRRQIAVKPDNDLTMRIAGVSSSQVIEFSKKEWSGR